MSRKGKKKQRHNHPLGFNYHHRKARTNGGSDDISSGNLVKVDVGKHRSFHHLFGTNNATQIAQHLTEVWIDPDWELIARRKTCPK